MSLNSETINNTNNSETVNNTSTLETIKFEIVNVNESIASTNPKVSFVAPNPIKKATRILEPLKPGHSPLDWNRLKQNNLKVVFYFNRGNRHTLLLHTLTNSNTSISN